jgi:hypothetical protein
MVTTDRANESYNIAVKYLREKYGYRRSGLVESARKRLDKAKNKKERKEIDDELTDDDYILIHNPIPDDDRDGKEIELLLSQYHYGYTVRFELYNKLCELGVIKYEE